MKKIEIASLLALNNKFAFLDEIDSGLDFDAIKIIAS
jgi:Fe-S cluster assembly ATPase SufC